jgi:hypothetical protein
MRWIATIGLAGLALTACGETADEAPTNSVETLPTDETSGIGAGEASSQNAGSIGQDPAGGADSGDGDQSSNGGDTTAGDGPGTGLPPAGTGLRFVGLWASKAENCGNLAWRFTAKRLETPAGSVCTFKDVDAVPGGYDIAASCTAEAPPRDDTLEIRFAESAKAMLFESESIADAGLVYCGRG